MKSFLYSLNDGKIPKKRFNRQFARKLSINMLKFYVLLLFAEACVNICVVRLAPEETSNKLTGFERNAVTCIGMKTDIPVSFYLSTPLLIYV